MQPDGRGREWKKLQKMFIWTAYNPGGMLLLSRQQEKIQKRTGKKAWLLFAAVADKEYETMAKELCEGLNWARIGVVHMNSDRGLSAGRLSDVLKHTPPARSFLMRIQKKQWNRCKTEQEMICFSVQVPCT